HPLAQRHRTQRAEDERHRHQYQRRRDHRLQHLGPERQPVARVVQALVGEVVNVVPQPADRQRLGRQYHGAEQLGGQRDVPALLGIVDDFGVVPTEVRGGHVGQFPVALGVLRPARKAGGLHVTLVVEAITRHAQQQPIGLHGVDVHELLALAVLAHQHADQHQYQHRLHDRPYDAPDGHAGSAHDGQFAAAGQAAQADQAADQRGHRQHVVQAPWRGQQHVVARVPQGVGIADVAHLVDEGEQRRQAEDDPQHGDDGHEHALADVAIEFSHGPPPHDGWR
uniref:Phenol hydroxylase n=1 Tax=Steinernema glaseri TaxID=37863 RepID=A0A1I7XWC7_9BILA